MMKRKYTFAALAAFAFMFASPAWATLPAPTSATFAKGAKFTVEGYAADKPALTGFPVLVRIAENSPLGFSYNDLVSKTTGADIAFVDMNDNGLPFEIDTWDPDGTSLIWVKLPSMQNGTEFVMCWGGATSGKTVCADNPFAGYKGVWHMNAASPADASGNGNNGTAAGSPTIVSGKIGSALSLPNTSAYVTCSTSLPNPQLASGFTVEGWANSSNLSGNHALFGKKQFISVRTESSGSIKVTTPGVTDHNGVSVSLSTGTWFHWAMTFVPGNGGMKFYVNGEIKNTQNASGFKDSTGSTEMWLGHNEWGGQEFLGSLDEYRLSADIKSADWIGATYATQSDSAFLTAGEAETYEASAAPDLGLVAPPSAVLYTNATLTATIGSLGKNEGMTTDADWVDPLLVVSANADLSNPVFSVPLSRVSSVPASFSVPLAPLALTTTYYAQVFATNSFGVAGESGVVSFTTPVPGPVFTASVSTEHIVPDITLSFTSQGLGLAVTQITVQVSSSGDFANPDLSKTLLVDFADMPVSFDDIMLTGLPVTSSLHYRFIAENSDGYATTVDLEAANPVGDGNNVWSGLSENIDDPDAYVFAGGLPAAGKTLYFTRPAGLSPIIDRDVAMPSLRFTNGKNESVDTTYLGGYHSCGYNLSGSGVLTFTADKPILQASYGTNTIGNPILFSRSDSQTVTIQSVGDEKA